MAMKRMTALAIATVTALGLGTAVVLAQPFGPGSGYGPGAMMGGGYGPGAMMGGGVGTGAMMGGGFGPGMMGGGYNADTRLDAQKTALGITSDQEKAWNAYAELVKTQADSMLSRHQAMWNSNATSSADRLALHSAFITQRAQEVEALNKAYADLYAVLTPEQRATADQGAWGYGYGKRGRGPAGS
jgi:Spy/CpxP family protein refolding chaperone